MRTFPDRRTAGQELANLVRGARFKSPVVFALPRGGIPIATEVARALHAPLDVVIVRKLGHPMNPEYAIGAIGEDGITYLRRDAELYGEALAERGQMDEIERRIIHETQEVKHRVAIYRDGREALPVKDRTAIVVDDGLATGATAETASRVLRGRGASRVVLCVPVASRHSVTEILRTRARGVTRTYDEVISLVTSDQFSSVGEWYENFEQVSEEEAKKLLIDYSEEFARSSRKQFQHSHHAQMNAVIRAGSVHLPANLTIPDRPIGVVIFAHGSGSGRLSPRNLSVSRKLNEAGFATLLFDLLTSDEAMDQSRVFDIPLLGRRLLAATRWVHAHPELQDLRTGYFGASTGAGAALWAAAQPDSRVAAVVSRGGRPDLAGSRLSSVTAPVLLIVGGDDEPVIRLNESAQQDLLRSELVIIPGATHLFEEPGALERVAELGAAWFARYLEKVRRAA